MMKMMMMMMLRSRHAITAQLLKLLMLITMTMMITTKHKDASVTYVGATVTISIAQHQETLEMATTTMASRQPLFVVTINNTEIPQETMKLHKKIFFATDSLLASQPLNQ